MTMFHSDSINRPIIMKDKCSVSYKTHFCSSDVSIVITNQYSVLLRLIDIASNKSVFCITPFNWHCL